MKRISETDLNKVLIVPKLYKKVRLGNLDVLAIAEEEVDAWISEQILDDPESVYPVVIGEMLLTDEQYEALGDY
jgi:hypothetical protein